MQTSNSNYRTHKDKVKNRDKRDSTLKNGKRYRASMKEKQRERHEYFMANPDLLSNSLD